MKTIKSIRIFSIPVLWLITITFCFGQYSRGGWQEGEHGDGGDEVMVGYEESPLQAFNMSSFIYYPNPFHHGLTVEFYLTRPVNVELTIHDVNGKYVTTLIDQSNLEKGLHKYTWEAINQTGNPVAIGVYYLKFRTGQDSFSNKVVYY